MSMRQIVLSRQSAAQHYGFTIEHVATYPPPSPTSNFAAAGDNEALVRDSPPQHSPIHTILVSRVDSDGIAARNGIRSGDRVVAIEEVPVLHLSHKQAQEMVHNSGHRLSLMIVSSRRPPSRPPSTSEDGRGAACRRLFCDEAEGRTGVMMPHMHQTHTLDSSPLRQSRLNGHHNDLLYDDTDSSSIPTVPSLSSVTSSGSNGYVEHGHGNSEFYEAMLREKRRDLNSSPRVSCYIYPNQDSRIRALFDEMRPKIEDSRVCGSTAASVTSFSSSPSPPQDSHRYGQVKPRIKLAEPDSWMRRGQQQCHTLDSPWKRAPFVQNQWNKRHGAGDWSGRFEEFQQQDREIQQKPFDYRTSKRQASFMAAVNGRGSTQDVCDQAKSTPPDSAVLSPPSVILSGCTTTRSVSAKPPIPGTSTVSGTTKVSLRSKKACNQRANDVVVDGETPSAPLRRRPRNDPRRKTIHDFAQALEAEQQQHKKERNMLESGVASDGESSTAKSRVPSATTNSAVNSSTSHNLQPTARTTRQRPVSYMMATGSPTRTGLGGFDAVPLSASQSSIPTASTRHHRRALASFAPSNLSPADAGTKPATSAALSPSPHGSKINKFIAFFSNHEPSQHKSLDLSTASERREVLKRAATTGTATTSATGIAQGHQKLVRPVKQGEVQYQGQVFHKEVCFGESSKRTAARRWDQCFAVLHRHRLYLCKQLSSSQATDDDPLNKILNIPGDAKVLEVKAAIVDIAYEVLQFEQRHNVVRIMTQQEQHVEHFIQTESESAMLAWIEKIRSVADSADTVVESADESRQPHAAVSTTNSADSESSLPSDRTGSASSNTGGGGPRSSTITIENAASAISTGPATTTLESASVHGGSNSVNSSEATSQLIMHRYKAKTNQLGSPHASKKSVDESLDGLLGGPSTSTDGNILTALSSSGDTITPKSGRRWKKSKAAKQGSGSSGRSDKTGTGADKSNQATSTFGKKIGECVGSGEEGDLVPLLVQICIRVVEAHGMETVGIYRIPGNTAAVNALKEALSQGFHSASFQADARWRDVNVVSSLLKMFLRNLPEPLLTDKLYPFFIDANRIASHHNRLHKIRNLLRKLPDEHYATLKYLMGHFRSVVSHSAVNKMEVRNMALMFGPSIVRPSDDTMATLVTHMSDQCRLIESFINYFDWMFDDNGTADQEVPEQVAGEQQNTSTGAVSQLNGSGAGGVHMDTGPMTVASFNDMHNLLRKVNEQEAVALMNENKSNKITKILNVRRNSRKDKSKSKKMPTSSTSSIGHDPPSTSPAAKQSRSQTASVDSAFCGHYQERDIDAEIACRQATVPAVGAAPASATTASSPATNSRPMTSSSLDKSPSVGSSLGSYEQQSQSSLLEQPVSSDVSEMRRRRLQNLYSARRIFIAGTDADDESVAHHADPDDLASHSRHLNAAGTPALDVLSKESREKIQRIQKLQSWSKTASTGGPSLQQMDSTTSVSIPMITKGMSELTVDDAVSLTSDYSTTSSAAPMHVPMSVSCHMDQLGAAASSDYASSDVSPAPRGDIVSPTGSAGSIRPTSPEDALTPSAVVPQRSPSPVPMAPAGRIGAKLRFRNNRGRKDPLRRHTLSDMDAVREALANDRAARTSAAAAEQTSAATTDSIPSPRLNHTSTSKVGKFARWIKNSFRKSSPDLRSIKPSTEATDFVFLSGSPRSSIHRSNLPPLTVPATESKNCSATDHRDNRHLHELTPVSTDEQL